MTLHCIASLQSTLHNKAISVNSATPTVICIVLNKQHWSHKRGCQYIQYNSAPYTYHKHNTHTFASSSASSCVPQPSKQLLNACHVPPMHAIVTLLAGCQSAILSSNEWHNDMNPAFISTIMAPNFEIKEITSGMRRSIPIPNLPTTNSPPVGHGSQKMPGALTFPKRSNFLR